MNQFYGAFQIIYKINSYYEVEFAPTGFRDFKRRLCDHSFGRVETFMKLELYISYERTNLRSLNLGYMQSTGGNATMSSFYFVYKRHRNALPTSSASGPRQKAIEP
jgi:hypothetical protein